jgi:small subunit ribosomal protein S2
VEEKKEKTMQENASIAAAKTVASDITVPDIKDFLKAGVQFGHETTRWNPKMKKYIFGAKNNIHVIDLQQTMPMLQDASRFLTEAAKRGPILFVATKRQARDIVRQYAQESGSYYVTYRWLGGLLTNFRMVKKSLQKMAQIEEEFEKGVTNRTKFEINKMKKEWDRMNRIYSGVKTMERYPEAVVIVDCHFEKGAVEEAKAAGLPVVAMVDTNSNPDLVDYIVPANDDAIKSITLVMGVLTEAIKKGNPGKWVKHVNKDYTNYEVPVIKEQKAEEPVATVADSEPKHVAKPRRHEQSKGIMERIKEQAKQETAEPKKEAVEPKKKAAAPKEKTAASKPAAAKKSVVKATVKKEPKAAAKKQAK